MQDTLVATNQPAPIQKGVRCRGPIWTLILLAPFLSEVLSGSTRLSVLFVYIPEVMVWGVGALLCRELVRRWRAGGTSLLLMGLALSVAEEFLIQQTSLAPLPFPGSHADYGRLWGVNLVYLLFMLGFESVWVVVVPVQVTELMFPTRSRESWLRRRGLMVACVVFLLGCRTAWYGWTQRALPMMRVAPYHPPLVALACGVAGIVMLIGLAYLLRDTGKPAAKKTRASAGAWVAGVAAFLASAAWWLVIMQLFIPKPIEPWWVVLVAGISWSVLAFALFASWASRPAWGLMHRWAAAFGATLGCTVSPYLSLSSWPKADLVAVVIFDVAGIVMFLLLGRRVARGV